MGSAIAVLDVVRVTEDRFLVGARPLKRDLDDHGRGPTVNGGVTLGDEVNDLRVNRFFRRTEMLNELAYASLKKEGFRRPTGTFVTQVEDQAGVQKRELANSVSQRVVTEIEDRENLEIWLEADLRAGRECLADALERVLGYAARVLLLPDFAVALDLEFQRLGARVDRADANTVKSR